MIILGIETSCDETAAAVLEKNEDQISVLSNVIASSAPLQSKYGGIIPEQAAREQIKSIIPVIEEAINDSRLTINDIDAIAVTQGPGLIGSLLVGVETAKVLSLIWQKPLIPVNHLLGHFYANWITEDRNLREGDAQERSQASTAAMASSEDAPEIPERQDPKQTSPSFPCIGLLVSGGHTDLVLFKNHGNYLYLGGTRDDAAGECFDKCARLLGLPYPGGPEISRLARSGNPKSFNLPRPMLNSKDFDFSYSGLKTAVSNLVNSSQFIVHSKKNSSTNEPITNNELTNLCASIEQAIIDPLVKKTLKAAKLYKVKTIILGGGVAANDKLSSELQKLITHHSLHITLLVPPAHLCTDNASMIASAAFFQKPIKDPLSLQADPNLSLSQKYS